MACPASVSAAASPVATTAALPRRVAAAQSRPAGPGGLNGVSEAGLDGNHCLGSCSHDGCNQAELAVKVIVDLCVVPIGVGVHLAPFIAACEKVLTAAGLKIQLHPNGTAIEGEWEPVFAAIEACHQAVHAMDCPRV